MPRERTHWEGCWRERTHHECALDRVAALEAELARVKGELRQANNVRDVFAQAVVQTATGEYEELANERKRREDAEALLRTIRGKRYVIFDAQIDAYFARYKD